MQSEWPVGIFSSLEAMKVLTIKPTPESALCCRFLWPEESVSGVMLLEAAFSLEAVLAKGSNVDI